MVIVKTSALVYSPSIYHLRDVINRSHIDNACSTHAQLKEPDESVFT